ncbi:UNVERIFIED_CONTAM: hypothetical protein Sradi_2077400 [Sesamum radiatum]|uniref:CCHC-type domain-containing protein n=1 Tax=Sesamum radiatum TaxID=300843 RepID=A0AAW2TL22_SESRA
MTRGRGGELAQFDPEIERSFHRQRNTIERGDTIENSDTEEHLAIIEPTMDHVGVVERPMMEYSFPTADGTISSIALPTVQANNFEIKPSIIQIIRSSVQFSGLPEEDPNKHLSNFLEICDTFKFNGVNDDAVRLRIFPFSLRDTAKDWLQSLPAGSITTWASLTQKFLAKYFPPAKTAKMLNDITSFVQLDRESLYDAWERFKGILRRCPHHELPMWRQVQPFYNGVTLANRATIDAAAGGTIMKKLLSEVFNIIDEIATNLYSYGLEKTDKRVANVHSIDAITTLSAQMAALTHKVDNLGVVIWNGAPIRPCGACGQMGHLSQDCKEVISNKRKWEGGETVKLNEECSAVLQNKLPPKLKDPGSFSIPCTIGNTNFDKVLCDLGASVNLMPYSIFDKLGMHELTPTIITLQLADRNIKYPRGIVEDVLVKVGKFIIPVDFIVLDMEEDVNMPLILERPFLVTRRALIDVQKGQLTLRVNDEHVVFNVFKPMKYLHKNEHDICAIKSINSSNGNNLQGMKEEHKEAKNFVDAGHGPNRKKRWRNQAYENVGLYKEHTKARDEFHMKKKKFKDGDKRHYKNKGPIKVDWQRIKHYLEGASPPPVEHSLLLSHP